MLEKLTIHLEQSNKYKNFNLIKPHIPFDLLMARSCGYEFYKVLRNVIQNIFKCHHNGKGLKKISSKYGLPRKFLLKSTSTHRISEKVVFKGERSTVPFLLFVLLKVDDDTKKNLTNKLKLEMSNKNLTPSDYIRFLRIRFDHSLSFKNQLQGIQNCAIKGTKWKLHFYHHHFIYFKYHESFSSSQIKQINK
ncbi:hypothetical protein BpHYR1_052342 [Brachionus plicatilis]|uniref:Uncharacterized protein n=1 Tax=Brachionus plicatilis TaxID=10195 RepID=A0A3M7PI21_BRAPC|nr:hypothetical protein BpHYR1_052342 [Brachionus plicatilis]